IRARGPNDTAPGSFAWSVFPGDHEIHGNAGENAVVGIIDSGIDFRHAFFHELREPDDTPQTRIERIWDMGLDPADADDPASHPESGPDSALLGGGASYGVEYKREEHLNPVLAGTGGAMVVRHRDCDGHGTHVAAIAAGNG